MSTDSDTTHGAQSTKSMSQPGIINNITNTSKAKTTAVLFKSNTKY